LIGFLGLFREIFCAILCCAVVLVVSGVVSSREWQWYTSIGIALIFISFGFGFGSNVRPLL